MSAEEIDAMQAEAQKAEKIERTRHLTSEEVTSLLIKQQINTLSVDDNIALRMVEFYPEWAAGVAYTAEYKVQHGGKTWVSDVDNNVWEPGVYGWSEVST